MKHIWHYHKKRVPILSWMVVPLVICWLGFNYIIGVMHKPVWDTGGSVLAESTQALPEPTGDETSGKYRFFRSVSAGFVTFWLDDGWASQYTNAFPILKDAKYTAALSVPTRVIGTTNYMNWTAVKQLDAQGWEIVSHSRTHTCDTKTLTPEKIRSETYGAKEDLLAHGIATDIFVTPCGNQSDPLVTYIKKFYLALRTGSGGISPVPVTDPYKIPAYTVSNHTTLKDIRTWIAKAEQEKGWLVLMFHQVDATTGDYSITPEFFRAIVSEVAKSKLTVALPTEVLAITGGTSDTGGN